MKAAFYTKETIRSIGMTNREFPSFGIGDMIIVYQSIKEGGKERQQAFQGNVIAFHKNGVSTTFIVRKIGDNAVAVERIYPYYSPLIKEIKVLGKGDVRRAKLFYLRHKVGKKSHVKQLVETKAALAKRREAEKKATASVQ
jgi:large subunit ribosomal protein L19